VQNLWKPDRPDCLPVGVQAQFLSRTTADSILEEISGTVILLISSLEPNSYNERQPVYVDMWKQYRRLLSKAHRQWWIWGGS